MSRCMVSSMALPTKAFTDSPRASAWALITSFWPLGILILISSRSRNPYETHTATKKQAKIVIDKLH